MFPSRDCRPVCEALEARVLYSADLAPIAASLSAPVFIAASEPAVGAQASQISVLASHPADAESKLASVELAVVDTTLPGSDKLIDDIEIQRQAGRAILVVRVQAGEDGINAVSRALAELHALDTQVSAVHFIGHGDTSGTVLGASHIDISALRKRAQEFASWADSLTADADLLLYGCDVASTVAGRSLALGLAQLTGADVAASDDRTGSSLLGGDWLFEYQTGNIETEVAISDGAQSSWLGVMATSITTGASTSAEVSSASSLSWSHTVSAGNGRLLFVEVAVRTDVAVTSITYGGQSMSQWAALPDSSGKVRNEIWYLVAPAQGTANVVVTMAGSVNFTAGATTFFGVDQTSPFRFLSVGEGSGDPSINVTSVNGDLVVGTFADRDVSSHTVGPGQTFLWVNSNGTGSGDAWAGVSSADGAASVTMSWTTNGGGAGEWAAIGVSLRPSANTAPVLDASRTPILDAINEDSGAPVGSVGTPVFSLIDLVAPAGQVDNVTDPDFGALLGIAVTSADTTNGTWFYTTDAGANWNPLGAVTASSARLLAADSNTRLYFRPIADSSGTIAAAITFRAWDRTSSTNGGLADTSVNGAATEFSIVTDTASLTVSPVNDAPSLSTSSSFNAQTEDVITSSGTLVSVFASAASDVDVGALQGLAITSVDNTRGIWQYTLDGTNWLAIGNVSTASARLLPSDAISRIRFLSDPDWNGFTGLTLYRAWDQTSGLAGGLADVTTNGGTSAFSAGQSGSGLTVLAVNDAPTALAGSATLASVAEDSANPPGASIASLFSGVLDDSIDQVTGGSSAHSFAGVAVVANAANAGSEGAWQWYNGASWANIGTLVSTSSALVLAPGALVRFVPSADFNGVPGALTLRLIDSSAGAATSGATVNVATGGGSTQYSNAVNAVILGTSITPVNDEQFVSTNAGIGVAENSPGSVISAAMLLTSDADNSPAQLIYTISSAPLNGTLRVAGVAQSGGGTFTQADINAGLLTYDHNGSETTSDSVGFSVDDGAGASSTGSIAITVTPVNDNAPVIASNGGGVSAAVNVIENSVAVTSVSATDADLPAQTLTYSIIGGADAGRFALNGISGALSFVTAPDFEAPVDTNTDNVYDVIVQASDGILFDTQSISVTVTNANEAPVNSQPASVVTAEDTVLIFSAAGGNAISVADIDLGGGQIDVHLNLAAGGLLTLSQTTGLVFLIGDGSADADVRFQGTLSNVNAALDGLVFDPAADFNGAINLQVQTSDLGNSGSGGVQTDSDTISITVNAVNDAPLVAIVPATYNATEQTSLALHGTGISVADVDGGLATVNLTLSVGSGTLTIVGGGTGISAGGTGSSVLAIGTLAQLNDLLAGNLGGTITYLDSSDTPAPSTVFTVSLNDGGASGSGGAQNGTDTAVINILAVNDAPVITSAALTLSEGQTVTLAAADFGVVDPDSASFTYTLSAIAGGFFQLSSAPGTPITVFSSAQLSGGLVQFVDDGNELGPAFDITVNDGSANSNTLSASISYNSFNDGPTITAPAAQSLLEDGTLAFSLASGNAISIADADAGVGSLQLTLSASRGTLSLGSLAGLSLVTGSGANDPLMAFTGTLVSINNALNTLNYQAGLNFSGADLILIQLNDFGNSGAGGALIANSSIALGIAAVNDAPILGVPTAQSVSEDTPLVFSVARGNAMVLGDVDSAGSPVQLSLSAGNGTISLARTTNLVLLSGTGFADKTIIAQGTINDLNAALDGLIYLPDVNFNGPAVLNVSINDLGNIGAGASLSVSQGVLIAVNAVNDAPSDLLRVPAITLVEGSAEGSAAGTVEAIDPDDSTGFVFSLVDGANHFSVDPLSGAITVAAGTLPDFAVQSSYQIIVRGIDPSGAGIERRFTIQVARSDVVPQPAKAAELGGAVNVSDVSTTRNTSTSITPVVQDEAAETRRVFVPGDDDPGAGRKRVVMTPFSIKGAARSELAAGRIGQASGEESRRNEELLVQMINDRGDEVLKRGLDRRRLSDLLKFESVRSSSDVDGGFDLARYRPMMPLAGMDWEPQSHEVRNYQVMLETVQIGGVAMSIGLLFYALRAGGLVAAMLTALPAWSSLDPLVILHKDRKDKGNEWGDQDLTEIDQDEAAMGAILDINSQVNSIQLAHDRV